MERLGIWIAALMTLSAYSYLWKENPFFRVGEHLLIATNVSYLAITGYNNIKQSLAPITTEGRYSLIVPVILGVLLFTRWFPKLAWLSRISVAFMMGVAGAVSITGAISANFVKQIAATMIPLNSIDNIIMVFGTICTVSYFLFIQGKSPAGQAWGKATTFLGDVGKWVMMVAFGAAFGATVMGRLTLVMGRLQFLFGQWIPLIK
ncbi:MAG: hypothetical protein ACOX5Q_10595 [Bacillota bacterium]|jgi:hypothetical protein|nr:hypothetical protein [Candidatus Fermentithermobacillaceae bacterium]